MKHVLAVLTLTLVSLSANAITVVPTGLNPGDQYRLVFVTSTTRDATSTNIADYNAFVTTAANSVPELLALGTTWTAIGSTATVDARDNTGTNPSSTGVPIYLLNNTKLADNNADLWDSSLDTSPNIDQTGATLNTTVWTGSKGNGTQMLDSFSNLNTLGALLVARGGSLNTSSVWMVGISSTSTGLRSFYAMSGVMTVPAVPVPPAVWLFGSALGLMGALRRKISG